MKDLPKISIVTPSLNQKRYIRETLQSLVDQNYANLEVVIQDAGSTDGSIDIAKEFTQIYPSIFQLYIESDEGQADGINKGFSKTTGEILGFLNSDDTLYPGCLTKVADSIDPKNKRWIVFGRCVFTGENSSYVGVEHPAEYSTHFEQLAIWKRGYNNIPQPSVFWHRQVWERCGGMDVEESHALDYDLFNRFSRHYKFHKIDQIFSTYRMHEESKTSAKTEAEVLELSIRVSRKHWGPIFLPLHWRCALSHWRYRRRFHENARHHARKYEESRRSRNYIKLTYHFIRTFIYSPSMATGRLISPVMDNLVFRGLKFLFKTDEGFTGIYADGWIGPLYRERMMVPEEKKKIGIEFEYNTRDSNDHLEIELLINGKSTATKQISDSGAYFMEADIMKHAGKQCDIELKSNTFFIPSMIEDSTDNRKLTMQLKNIRYS